MQKFFKCGVCWLETAVQKLGLFVTLKTANANFNVLKSGCYTICIADFSTVKLDLAYLFYKVKKGLVFDLNICSEHR